MPGDSESKRFSELSMQKLLKIKDSTNLSPVKSLKKFLSPSKIRDRAAEYQRHVDSQRKIMLREVNQSIDEFEGRDDLMSPSGSHLYFLSIFDYSNAR